MVFYLIINFKNFCVVFCLLEFQVFFFVREIWVCVLKQALKLLRMIVKESVFICWSNHFIFLMNVSKFSLNICFEFFFELLITMWFFVILPTRLFCSFNCLNFLFQKFSKSFISILKNKLESFWIFCYHSSEIFDA